MSNGCAGAAVGGGPLPAGTRRRGPILGLAKAMGWTAHSDAVNVLARRLAQPGRAPQAALFEKWTVDGRTDWAWEDDGRQIRQQGWFRAPHRSPMRTSDSGSGAAHGATPAPSSSRSHVSKPERPGALRVCRRTPEDPTHVFPIDYLSRGKVSPTAERRLLSSVGDRRGANRSRLGPPTAMPSRTRQSNARNGGRNARKRT